MQVAAAPRADRASHPGLAELDELPTGGPDQVPLRSLTLDLTHTRQFKCPGCIERWARARSRFTTLSSETVRRLIAQFSQQGGAELLLYGGEPTTHPQFGSLMEFAAQQVRCVRLVTNGALLYRPTVAEAIARAGDQAQVSVRVSLNAGTPQTHDRLHGVRGFFPRIVQGMKQLSQLNPQVELGVSFLVEEANAAELQQAFQIAEEVGAQYLWVRPRTGLHGIGLVPLTKPTRLRLWSRIVALGPAGSLGRPRLRVDRWFEAYLQAGTQPDTTKPYACCYYCAASRLVIAPPELGVAWACAYWRGHHRFHVADLALASFGSAQFEERRRAAIYRVRPGQDCAEVICNRHEGNLAIQQHLQRLQQRPAQAASPGQT